MKLIHVTDIHLTADKTDIAGQNPYQNFQYCLQHIMQHNADADRMIITGDLAHKGQLDAYQQLSNSLAEFPIHTDLVIGNHDNRDLFYQVFPDAFQDQHGFVQGVTETVAGYFITLDSVSAGEYGSSQSHAGFYDKERFDWLHDVLNNVRQQHSKACLFMHHHPRDILVAACDAIGFQAQQQFRKLLIDYRDCIRYVFFGHCHMPLSGTIASIPFASLRGTNHQVVPDFSGHTKFKMAALNPAYNVVFFEQEDVIVHTVDYRFHGKCQEVGTSWQDWEKYGSDMPELSLVE